MKLSDPIRFESLKRFIFEGPDSQDIELPAQWRAQVETAHKKFLARFETREPIYGVTTGFGDSCYRRIDGNRSELLQENLIRYLSCGTGPILRRPVRRAIALFRLVSLAKGLSGVSPELIDAMTRLVERDWLPLVPAEGSLGASGDLIPLAYLAQSLQGWGEIETQGRVVDAAKLFAEYGEKPYKLKPKEGLALVNGTTAMAAQAYVNVIEAEFLLQLAVLQTSWLVLALSGRNEPFSPLVNQTAKNYSGQKDIAEKILSLLNAENYQPITLTAAHGLKEGEIQDRYSMRCSPQILGPVLDTIRLVKNWVETDINGVSDNPLVDVDSDKLMSGGNFYGGYLSQGMDYLKISLSHVADMVDRQVAYLIDEKSNRGLPPNLANWPGIPQEDRTLHHGLKGLHQAISAVTSEIISKSMPVSIFSRSTESHNQDKVSLGMGAAVSCESQLDQLYRIQTMSLVCLAQALDLKGIQLKGEQSRYWYEKIRNRVPFVEKDCALDKAITQLSLDLRELSTRGEYAF